MTLGKRIEERREAASLDKKDVARLMGVSYETVRQWESDETTPRPAKIEKLAKILNTSPNYLLADNEVLDVTRLEQILNKLDQVCREAGQINPPNKMKAQFIADLYSGNPEGKPPNETEIAKKASMWSKILGSLSDSLRPRP